jgi:hypothetical protein
MAGTQRAMAGGVAMRRSKGDKSPGNKSRLKYNRRSLCIADAVLFDSVVGHVTVGTLRPRAPLRVGVRACVRACVSHHSAVLCSAGATHCSDVTVRALHSMRRNRLGSSSSYLCAGPTSVPLSLSPSLSAARASSRSRGFASRPAIAQRASHITPL